MNVLDMGTTGKSKDRLLTHGFFNFVDNEIVCNYAACFSTLKE